MSMTPNTSSVLRFLPVFLIFLLTVWSGGFEPVGGNNFLQIPMVRRLINPHAYPNDPLVDAMVYYSSPHWYFVAMVSRFVPLETLLFVLFLLTRLLMVSGAYVLACVLAPSAAPWVGYLAASVFVLQPNPLVGEGTIAYPYHEHSSLAQAVLLWCAVAFVKHRRLIWAVLLGIVFNLTVLYGVAGLVYYGAALLIVGGEYRKAWKEWAKSLIVLLIVASPALWMLGSHIGQEGYPLAEWVAIQRARSWFHIFPLSFPIGHWLKLGLLVAVVLLLSVAVRHRQPVLARWMIVWTFVMAIWIALAFIAVYVVPNRLLIAFQPVRATDPWYPVAVVSTLCAACILFDKSLLRSAVAALLIGAVFAIWRFDWYRQAAILFLSAPVAVLSTWRWRRMLLPAMFLVYLLVSTIIVVSAMRHRGWVLASPAELREGYGVLSRARQDTPRDAVLLVPPHWSHARVVSERSVFVTWKDGTATLFRPSYTAQWVERMRALGWDPVASGNEGLKHPRANMYRYTEATFWMSTWRRLDDTAVIQLRRRYGVTHWVLEANHPTDFPEVSRSDGWKLVRVLPPISTTPTSQPRRDNQR
ncbi:MAG: DUF6798 domain-containing protein [Armatimonadota bacterium]